MQTQKIRILLSEIDLKHFILSNLMKDQIKTNFWKAIFENVITHSAILLKNTLAFAHLPLKIKVAKKLCNMMFLLCIFNKVPWGLRSYKSGQKIL